jgi:RNA polymerase sigma-70 factor (ECF subfamily)
MLVATAALAAPAPRPAFDGCPSTAPDPLAVTDAVTVLRAAPCDADCVLGPAERDALGLLFHRYAPMLQATATRVLGSVADAEDAVQDLFCRLPWLLAQYRGHGLGGWLRRAVTTRALMHLRRTRARPEGAGLDARAEATSARRASRSDDGEIAWALRHLPPSLRDVVVLYYFVGYSHREIAETLEVSETASEVRLCRALKQMRVTLQGTRAAPPSWGPRRRSRRRAADGGAGSATRTRESIGLAAASSF